MKKFTKKSVLQKTIIAILVALLLSNFIVPTYSHADWGGALLSPVVDLLCSIGDAVINLLQVCMSGEWASSDLDFSFNAFMVEDDEFFVTDREKYVDRGYIVDSIPDGANYETIDVDAPNDKGFDKGWLGTSNKYHIPVATYSPEQIFAGNVAGLDINFINPNKYKTTTNKEVESSAAKLQQTIATWYVALRNLTVVGLLSVLVYVGIRIILSSTASDKAKYKQMLADWLIALCLVFFLHYIMSFVLTLTESISTAISGDGQSNIYVEVKSTDNESGIFKTNLLGLARFKTQYQDFGQKMAYLIMYLALVIYTLIFTWFYLKRLLMMAFLTLIAPVVALTYPIDKISDGKAQAFDSWLKEYVFNALIQPFHLIIYTVFVGSAMDLASTNIIYMIAALAFILPAEKILRKFFGFEKAGAGTLGAIAGGAALASVAKKGMSMLGGGKGGSKQKPAGNNGEENKPPRFENKHDIADIEGPEGANKNDNALNELEVRTDLQRGEFTDDANAGDKKDNAFKENNSGIILPESVRMKQQQEEARKAREQQEAGRKAAEEQQANKNNSDNKNNKFMNWARGHNINKRTVGKAIKGVAKFGTRTAFKAGAGTLAAAVTLASGGGIAGAGAAFMGGATVGGRLGNVAIGLTSRVSHGVERMGQAGMQLAQGNTEEAANRLLGGTALGRELDLAYGNTRFQDIGDSKKFKTDENNLRYVGDMIAKEHGGIRPSAKEVKDKMNSLDPYIAEGLTDIKDMLKAQKAEIYTGSAKQAAIIAAIGKERGITADILNDDKKLRAQEANLKQDFMNKGYSEAAATKQANYTMNVLKVQNGVAHNMQKVQPQTEQKTKQEKPPRTKK